MCSVCNFCGSPSFLGKMKKYINRSVVCEGDSIPLLYFFWEKNPEPWPVFVRPLENEGLFVYNDHGILYAWEYITAVVSEGAKVLDICTTILPDLASEGSPLLSNLCFPIIPFRFLETNVCWNQSSYGMNVPLTFIIFFAKVTTLFLKWKRISLLSNS